MYFLPQQRNFLGIFQWHWLLAFFQGPRWHFESGWANTSEVFEKKILKGPLFSKFSKSGWALIEFCLENLIATSMATFSITWFLQSDIVLKSSILRSLPTLWSRKYCLQKKACISGMHSLRVASFRIFSTYINSETSNSQTMHLLTMDTRNTSPYSIIFHLLHLGDEFYQTFLFNYLIPSLWQDSRKDTYNKSNT